MSRRSRNFSILDNNDKLLIIFDENFSSMFQTSKARWDLRLANIYRIFILPKFRLSFHHSTDCLSRKKNLMKYSQFYCRIRSTVWCSLFTWAMSFLEHEKLIKVTLTKSEPQQTVTVLSSSVSWDPIVTICLCKKLEQEKKINIIIFIFFVHGRDFTMYINSPEKKSYLWFLSILSCSDVTYSSNIKDIHFIILIDPKQIKSMLINFECDRRTGSGILQRYE